MESAPTDFRMELWRVWEAAPYEKAGSWVRGLAGGMIAVPYEGEDN